MQYPYKAWKLMPSMMAREVEITQEDYYRNGFLKTKDEKYVHRDEVFKTKEEAIAGGYAKLEKQKASLETQKALLAKLEANLRKQIS